MLKNSETDHKPHRRKGQTPENGDAPDQDLTPPIIALPLHSSGQSRIVTYFSGPAGQRMGTMSTFMANAQTIQPKWIVIDATDLVVGRLAVTISNVLRGKHK